MKTHDSSSIASTSLCAALSALWLVSCGGSSNNGSGEATAGTGGVGTSIFGTGGAGTSIVGGGGAGTSIVGTGGVGAGGAGRSGVGTGGVGTGRAGSGMTGTGGVTRGASGSGGVGTAGVGGTSGAPGSGGEGGASGALDCSGPALTGGTPHCSSNAQGTAGSYSWSIWSSGSGGCVTPYGVGAAFKATWSNSGDFLAREGFQWDETKTYDQYGAVSADYAYTKTGTAGGYSFIGIYGWSNNPLIEYYIVDDWYGTGSPPTANGTLKGTFTADGATYNIYTHTQTNQPSIHGTATFNQFFSIRQTPRQCGHISITEHFKKWASLGMTLGKMYEAKILIEAGGGTGSIDFTTARMNSQ